MTDKTSEPDPKAVVDAKPDQSNLSKAEEIKRRTDDLMQYIRDSVPVSRERALALTAYEEGAMWATKSVYGV